MNTIIEQTLGKIESVIADVNSRLPGDFPEDIAAPVFDGIRKAGDRAMP